MKKHNCEMKKFFVIKTIVNYSIKVNTDKMEVSFFGYAGFSHAFRSS